MNESNIEKLFNDVHIRVIAGHTTLHARDATTTITMKSARANRALVLTRHFVVSRLRLEREIEDMQEQIGAMWDHHPAHWRSR